jgi:hypothetical protein
MLKLKKNILDGKWFDYTQDSCELKFYIKPLSVDQIMKLQDNEYIKDIFDKILIDWSGVIDEEGKELKCIKINKDMLYESYQNIVMFIVSKSIELKTSLIKEVNDINIKSNEDK